MKQLEKYADYAYAMMRIMAGFMFSFHGFQKILGILSDFQPPVGSQLWFGGMIELICGLLGAGGLSDPLGCFPGKRRDGRGLFSVPLEVPNGTGVLSNGEQR